MSLRRLEVRDFRCFDSADLDFSPQTNLILGENASGKTSLLEAIFFLSRGRSFRSARSEILTKSGRDAFLVRGEVTGLGTPLSVGIGRIKGRLEARLGGGPVENLAKLAETLPVQLLDASAHHLIEAGPRHRRQYLDWGVFHVEPTFLDAWRRYQRALKQRNTLLRRGTTDRQLQTWEPELIETGERLDQYRRGYLEQLEPLVVQWSQTLLGGEPVSLRYRQGWLAGQSLAESLEKSRPRDREAGSGQVGPHRADILVELGGKPVQLQASRGQQKVLAGALLLAQAKLMNIRTGRPAILLIDDLAAELDAHHLGRFIELVRDTKAQVFLTAINQAAVATLEAARMFHVERGGTCRMV